MTTAQLLTRRCFEPANAFIASAPKDFLRQNVTESCSSLSTSLGSSPGRFFSYFNENSRSSLAITVDSEDMTDNRRDSYGQEKDSGVECFDEDFIPPESELMGKIVTQVEAYFSDENLSKDAFLLKHVRRNKDGLVSLKLVSSFRKIKALTKNWKVVAYSISKASTLLALNDTITKVKRVHVFNADTSGVQEAKPSQSTAIVYSIPSDKASIAAISQEFAIYGDIVSVKLYRNNLPQVCINLLSKYPTMAEGTVALVEFEQDVDVAAAIEQFQKDSQANWRQTMRIVLIDGSTPAIGAMADSNKLIQSREKRSQTIATENPSSRKRMGEDIQQQAPSTSTSTKFQAPGSPNSRLAQKTSSGYQSRLKSNSVCVSSVVREHNRLTPAMLGDKENSRFGSNERLTRSTENLVRQPRGPDGSRGFKCRGSTMTNEQLSESVISDCNANVAIA